jgi:UDP-N-acetylmuramoylalanine--D-glutamate ligase
MTSVAAYSGQTIAVVGLGLSGLASCRSLLAGGASVVAWDDKAEARETAKRSAIPVLDLSAADWRNFAALVLAPGIPLTHPEPHWSVTRARRAGIEIIGDVELFCRERARRAPDAPFVAVTGTNGKSTTTALLAHLLKTAGRDVQMGGNIGIPILSLAPPDLDRVHVVEMSSFQIDLTPSLRPSIGVLLNISPDHLDRHGTMERYAVIKERVVANADHPIIGEDDDWCRQIAEKLRLTQRSWVDVISACSRVPHGWYTDAGRLITRAPWTGPAGAFADLTGIATLRGRHNAQNALAASAAAMALGVTPAAVASGLATFPGLPHRLEEIGRQGRTLFINDSKATNADSAATALATFPDGIYWLAGGRAKEGGIAGLTHFFPRIAKAYLIGEASDEFAATLEGKVAFEQCGALDAAVAAAARDAAQDSRAEPVVLLSPACASYDQFKNFEVRGNAFRALVTALPGFVPRARG